MFDLAIDCSDAESKVGQRLSGVPPWETQHECTTELIGSDLVEHEKQGRHPWWRCDSVSESHWGGLLEGKLKKLRGLERYWSVPGKSAPEVLFQAWSQGILGQVPSREWWVFRRILRPGGLHMVQVQWGACHQIWDDCQHIGCVEWTNDDWRGVGGKY